MTSELSASEDDSGPARPLTRAQRALAGVSGSELADSLLPSISISVLSRTAGSVLAVPGPTRLCEVTASRADLQFIGIKAMRERLSPQRGDLPAAMPSPSLPQSSYTHTPFSWY